MSKKIVIDLDDTISFKKDNGEYENATPHMDVIERLHYYKELGFEICIFTARNMRTFDGNIGKINAYTLPIIIKWLNEYRVPYDEIIVGKPWCGYDGFYVDDRAIRPNEFVNLSHQEIVNLIKSG